MKNLFPKQAEACEFFTKCLRTYTNTLDTSDVGTGKTVVASHIAKDLLWKEQYPNPHFSSPFVEGVDPPRIFSKVAVICPKAVIPAWERELEETGIEPLFVLNYEKIRMGRTEFMSKRGKKIMTWNIPENTLVLVDEIHKCKGAYTQNAQLLISLVQQGFRVHGMSATAAEDPTEMRALGYMLGLHSLNKNNDQLKNWYGWMKINGCDQDHWNKWYLLNRSKLEDVKNSIYGTCGYNLTVADFPDSFRNNRVFVERIKFSEAEAIKRAYKTLNITPDIIEKFIDDGTVEDSEFILVNILRARQLTEALKCPDIVDMANDLAQKNSVVVFVNFRDTVNTLCDRLGCERIEGGQSIGDRQKIIDDFQSDKNHIIVVNIAAGGTGLSLHDTIGNRPRVSLICPSYNAKEYAQTLGRIHRNGAKSDALQKILVASGTVEENVMNAISRKIDNMNELLGV